jgi:bifunctional non-homologous end joining protein LigD
MTQRGASSVTGQVGGRELTLSNLDKPLFADGTTKGQVVDYYASIASVILPHLRDRPVTVVRAPDGVEHGTFLQKQAPSPRPEWIGVHDFGDRQEVLVGEVAALVWLANLAAIELHTPQWRGNDEHHDQLVLDLDPGPGVDQAGCARVALLCRTLLAELTGNDREVLVKTSGRKGLHLLIAFDAGAPRDTARDLATILRTQHPDLVVSTQSKAQRPGKVLVDWSQNSGHRTTASVYSLRTGPAPIVSAPLTWDEVGEVARGRRLQLGPHDVLTRVAEHGDLFRALLR